MHNPNGVAMTHILATGFNLWYIKCAIRSECRRHDIQLDYNPVLKQPILIICAVPTALG
jgi:hypothetical protein